MIIAPIEQKVEKRDFRLLEGEIPGDVIRYFNRWIDWDDVGSPVILSAIPRFGKVETDIFPRKDRLGGDQCIAYTQRLNDVRYVNKYLEAINGRLRMGGYFIGSVETSSQRRSRQMAKFSWPFNVVYCLIDYFVWRVWPKLPYLKRLYFALTRGRNRVLSEMETYGRLYSCGFHFLCATRTNDRLYFLVRKVKQPAFNPDPTYGPLIRLNRVGKNGKPIKVYKLRTMFPYAEYVQRFVYERVGLQSGGKIKEDPRVSAVGAILRKYFIDELPMLVNLLKGDLKLVGVRPLSQHYLSLYPKDFQVYRQRFKPGLIPPLYAEIPDTLEDIVSIEKRYLHACEQQPFLTDLRYLFRALNNILIKRARSH